MSKIQRNEPCPCGSGQKFKKCCIHLYQNQQQPITFCNDPSCDIDHGAFEFEPHFPNDQ